MAQEALERGKKLVGDESGSQATSDELEIALLHFHHVNELNQFTDLAKTAREISDTVSDTLFSRLFADAPTISLDLTKKVFEDQRSRLAALANTEAASSHGHVEVLKLGNASTAAFVIRDFVPPHERGSLLDIHRTEVRRNKESLPLICSGDTDAAGFVDKVRKEMAKKSDVSIDEVREAAFIAGYDCLLKPTAHSWVKALPLCAEETRHYAAEYTALDNLHKRVARVSGLETESGQYSDILTLHAGCGVEQRSACTTGGMYSPRKLRAATVLIALDSMTPDRAESSGGVPFFDTSREVELNDGDMLVVFNFGDIQDCDLSMAFGLTQATGSRTFLRRHYDNVHDFTLSHRAFHYRSMDSGPPGDDPEPPRSPYQPAVVCFEQFCTKHFDYGAISALSSARNEIELVPETYGDSGDVGEGDVEEFEETFDDAYWEE